MGAGTLASIMTDLPSLCVRCKMERIVCDAGVMPVSMLGRVSKFSTGSDTSDPASVFPSLLAFHPLILIHEFWVTSARAVPNVIAFSLQNIRFLSFRVCHADVATYFPLKG